MCKFLGIYCISLAPGKCASNWNLNLSTYYMNWYFEQFMMTSSNENISALLALCAGNSPVIGEFPSQRPVTRALMFSMICVWTNGWVNNRDTGDLRRNRAHYDATVMSCEIVLNGMPQYPTDDKLTLVDFDVWCHMASPGHNELTHNGIDVLFSALYYCIKWLDLIVVLRVTWQGKLLWFFKHI